MFLSENKNIKNIIFKLFYQTSKNDSNIDTIRIINDGENVIELFKILGVQTGNGFLPSNLPSLKGCPG